MTPLRFEAAYERRPLAPDRGAAAAVRWGVRASFEPVAAPTAAPDRASQDHPSASPRWNPAPLLPLQSQIGPILRYTARGELVGLELSTPSGVGFGRYLDLRA
jgi:hypothetical protein